MKFNYMLCMALLVAHSITPINFDYASRLSVGKPSVKVFYNDTHWPALIMIRPCLEEKKDGTGCLKAGPWILQKPHPLYGHITPPNEIAQVIFNTRLVGEVRWILFSELPHTTHITERHIARNFPGFPPILYEGFSCSNINEHIYFKIGWQLLGTLYCDTQER